MYGINEHSRIFLRRKLRAEMPLCESILWEKLRRDQLGFRCRRQMSIGRYVVDFCFWKQKLVVECDGLQHNEQEEYDTKRTCYLVSRGFRVLRYSNTNILQDTESIIAEIHSELHKPLPNPPLKGAGTLQLDE